MMLALVSFAMLTVLRNSGVSLCPWKREIKKGRMEIIVIITIRLPERCL